MECERKIRDARDNRNTYARVMSYTVSSLPDAELGERVFLLNFEHQPARTRRSGVRCLDATACRDECGTIRGEARILDPG